MITVFSVPWSFKFFLCLMRGITYFSTPTQKILSLESNLANENLNIWDNNPIRYPMYLLKTT